MLKQSNPFKYSQQKLPEPIEEKPKNSFDPPPGGIDDPFYRGFFKRYN